MSEPRKKEQKVYFPLTIGDWLKGTRGMKAEVRGVYINLLLYQWDNGFVPSDMEELCLIDPELPKVWVKLRAKFPETSPGKLQNQKCEEVRNFWAKQKSNGQKGGRPKNENPNNNPDVTQNETQKQTIIYDLDNDIELKIKKECEEKLSTALDGLYLDQERIKWKHIDFDFELEAFKNKVRGSPDHYRNHDTGGIRLALQSQLRHAKRKPTEQQQAANNKSTGHINSLVEGFKRRHGGTVEEG